MLNWPCIRVHHSTARQGRAPATRAENEETLHRQRVTRRGGVTDCARMTHIAGLHASRFALTIFSLPAVAARSWFRDRSSMSCRFRSACSESDRAISGARRRPAAAHLHDGSATNQPTNGRRVGGVKQVEGSASHSRRIAVLGKFLQLLPWSRERCILATNGQ